MEFFPFLPTLFVPCSLWNAKTNFQELNGLTGIYHSWLFLNSNDNHGAHHFLFCKPSMKITNVHRRNDHVNFHLRFLIMQGQIDTINAIPTLHRYSCVILLYLETKSVLEIFMVKSCMGVDDALVFALPPPSHPTLTLRKSCSSRRRIFRKTCDVTH